MTAPSVSRQEAPEPVTPPLAAGGLPVLGHAWHLVHNPLDFLSQLRDHGDFVQIKLGPKRAYAATSPALVGKLLKSPDYEVGGPLWESLESLLGNGVATSNGRRHRRQRQTIQPAFSKRAIPGYAPVALEEAYAFADRWQAGDTVDTTAESFRIAVRITARCHFKGEAMDEWAERLSVALSTVFSGMYRRMVFSLGPLYRLPLPGNHRFDQALADLHRLVDEIIAERRASEERPDDLLTSLLEAKNEEGEPLSEQEIHDQVVAIVTPGSETLASTLMWIFQVLTEYPEQGQRVSDEVKSVVGNRPVTYTDLHNLPVTNNFLTEVLRLLPAVWVLTRQAKVDNTVHGYRVPAGTPILYSPFAMQRDPRSYADALSFDPDRWNPDRSGSIPRYAMIPFSTGNRKCPADDFSMMLLAVIVATLIPKWRFEQAPESDDVTRIGITLRPKQLLVRALAR
ncbi:cytochrome P450 [Streptomyces sp. T-3]|nr:cytochrome P450 [Streptomyces sp. T-3]